MSEGTGTNAAGAYTHGHHESVLRAHRWRTAANSAGYLLPHLSPGMSVLDVGCGPATITADLAAMVGDSGSVLGIDPSASVIEGAREAHPKLDLQVATLEETTGSFDVVHAHQVLQHLADPVEALRSMAALAAPGGLVAVRDTDYSAAVWSPACEPLDQWLRLYLAVTGHNGHNATAGRHLLAWGRKAGLTEVAYSTSTWTYAGDDAVWWGDLWAERVVASTFAEQAVAYKLASPGELAAMAEGWRAWSKQPDALFVIWHGELLARV